MTIRTLLLALATEEAAQCLAAPAAALARRTGAHLIGLHVVEAIEIYPGIAMHFGPKEMVGFQQAQEEKAGKIREIFEGAMASEDFVTEWRLIHANAVTSADRIIEHARSVDMVMMCQELRETERRDQREVLERVIREAGRPVLVVPKMGKYEAIGSKAMVGWAPTAESARAAHDALGILGEGAEADIVTIHHASNENDLARDTAKQLALCYDRHGVKATVLDRIDDGLSIGDILLNESFERGSDLIVTGAFGHSRAYDMLFGATTSYLLDQMTSPVMFSA
ncbi:MAG: universal stress protein [Pseudomonadota bacterium]